MTDRFAVFVRSNGKVLVERGEVSSPPVIEGAEPNTVVDRVAEGFFTESSDLKLIRTLDAIEAADVEGPTPLLIELFDTPTTLTRDEFEWVVPTELLQSESPSGGKWWGAYRRVGPSPSTLTKDYEFGAAHLSTSAVAALRDAVCDPNSSVTDQTALRELADELRDLCAGMAVLENRIETVVESAVESGSIDRVEDVANSVIERAVDADARAANRASALLDGKRVFTHSQSGTVLDAIRSGSSDSVIVTVSATDREGVDAAETLSEHTTVTLVHDAGIAHAIRANEPDVVLIGADAIFPDGTVVNKVGSLAAALTADRFDIDFYVVTSSEKLRHSGEFVQEYRSDAAVYDGNAAVSVSNPVFDRVPHDTITGIVTEDGILDPEQVSKNYVG